MKRTGIAAGLILAAAQLAAAANGGLDFDGRGGKKISFSELLAGTAVPAATKVSRSAPEDYIPDGERALGFIPPQYDISHLTGRSVIPASRAAESFPARYDLREHGKVSPVRDQGNCGSCWAHATMSALESALLPGENFDFSEQNIKNTVGFDRSHCDGGNADMVGAYLTRWSGPVLESEDPYDMSTGDSPYGLAARKHVQEILTIPPRANAQDNRNIKWALVNFGAVASSMYWSPQGYNHLTNSFYNLWPNRGSNHLVTIVGWDDNYDKNNFATPAPANGAFIVKNSWGTRWGENGFFYISYYDTVFGKFNTAYSAVEGTANYDAIYQYDPLGVTNYTDAAGEASYFANVFTAKRDETVTAAGFYTRDLNMKYKATVYVDVSTGTPVSGNPVSVTEGTIAIPGFHTVQLPAAQVAKGHRFSVVIRFEKESALDLVAIESPYRMSSRASANPGESFVSGDGVNWSDLAQFYPNTNVCLKAYTKENAR